jgi:hypothetical protein
MPFLASDKVAYINTQRAYYIARMNVKVMGASAQLFHSNLSMPDACLTALYNITRGTKKGPCFLGIDILTCTIHD